MGHSTDKSGGNHPQTFGRFCLVGGINTLVDFVIFAILYFGLNAPLLVAHILAFPVATLNSYLLNKYWTFKEGGKVKPKQFSVFLSVTVTGLLFSSIVIYFSAPYTGALLAKLLAIIATLVWNYTGSHLFVFKAR